MSGEDAESEDKSDESNRAEDEPILKSQQVCLGENPDAGEGDWDIFADEGDTDE